MMSEWPLVGRHEVLERCGALLGHPGVDGLTLVGSAGVGKSRVLAACAQQAADAGFATGRVAAHRSSSVIPFGALAPLLPPGAEMVSSGVPLLHHARVALAELGTDRPFVLAVDDAHLLDDASAVLVHQLASTQSAFVLLSMRTGQPAPDPIAGLVHADRVQRIELDPFDAADCRLVLEAALGGQVGAATVDALCVASGGNALLLRELVRGSLESGAIQETDAVWRLVAPLTPSAQLRDLVAERLATLDEDERLALELVALAEPLAAELLTSLAPISLESLEQRGFIAVSTEGRRVDVACAHPVHADVLRSELPTLRARRLCRSLAEAIEATGARRREDTLRVATMHLDGGGAAPASLLLDAAHQSYFANDAATAERLVRAALEVEPSFDARHLLEEVLYRQGRGEEADRDDASDEAGATDEQRSLRAMRRAATQFWQSGDRAAADETLADCASRLSDVGWRDEVIAQRATFDVNASDPALALERLATITSTGGRAALQATLVGSLALPHVGRAAEALASIPATREAFRSLGDLVTMYQMSLLASTEATALHELGRFDDASSVAMQACEESNRENDPAGRAFCALVLARVLLARGQPLSALRWAREAVVLFRELGHRGPLRWSLGNVALACALRGDGVVARAALAGVDELGDHAASMLDTDTHRAAAWLAIAEGHPEDARRALVDIAERCRERGLVALELLARHDLARVGGAVAVDRIAELAEGTQGDWLPALAADAAAIASGRPTALASSADVLDAMGARLLAAETARRASEAFARAGRQRDAASWSRRCDHLVAQCEGAVTPALARGAGPVPLTAREREIAVLASSGLSSKAIAERLYLSSRTIDNNLARVFTKLGVNDRSALGDALAVG